MATHLAPASTYAEEHREEGEDELPLPPLISLQTPLERTSSTPSSFSPSVAMPSRTDIGDFGQTVNTREEDYKDEIAEIRQTLGGRLHQSKSMQAMRPTMQSKRSGLIDRKEIKMVVMPRAASDSRSKSASAVPQANPVRPPLTSKSSGGFAAFLRKITGRSSSPPKSKAALRPTPALAQAQAQQSPRSSPQYTPTPIRPAVATLSAVTETSPSPAPSAAFPPLSRAASAAVVSTKPALPALNVDIPISAQSPLSAPPAPEANMILPGPTPFASPVKETAKLDDAPVDPCDIPLPVSPLLEPADSVMELEEAEEFDDIVPPLGMTDDAPLKGIKPSEQLSSDSSDTDVPGDMTDDASESEDIVRELHSISIPSEPRPIPGSNTPATPTSAIEEIVTPTSTVSTPPTYLDSRFAGISPPRKAPAGAGQSNGLGRKGSKWRRSMMGLSDTLNQKTTTRSPPPVRAPPTSYDAYLAHQKRIANNRVSCAPTLHSNATIAAGLREIKDQEGRDMAETFFM